MKKHKVIILLTVALMTGCGSLTPALESGQGFYSDLPESEVSRMAEAGKTKTSKLATGAIGCFALAPESVDKKIIEPAVRKTMTENHAFAAQNVKASRNIAPTVIDAITGAFIWGCSYWHVTGDLLQIDNSATLTSPSTINTPSVQIAQ